MMFSPSEAPTALPMPTGAPTCLPHWPRTASALVRGVLLLLLFAGLIPLAHAAEEATTTATIAAAPKPAAGAPYRELFLLHGEWRVAALGPTVPALPRQWLTGFPAQSVPATWPGHVHISSNDRPESVTVALWYPLELPDRVIGKAVWLELEHLEGPTRVFVNGQGLTGAEMPGGGGLSVVISQRLRPSQPNLLILQVRGMEQARRMLAGPPPRIVAGPRLNFAQLRIRPVPRGNVFWVDAFLRRSPGFGPPQSDREIDTDEYSVELTAAPGPEEEARPYIPDSRMRTLRIEPKQIAVSAPVPVEGATHWTPANPALYTIRATLYHNADPVDSVAVTTGFVEWSIADDRLTLTKKPYDLRGVELPSAAVAWAEESLIRDLYATGAGWLKSAPSTFDDNARRARIAWWMEVLRPIKAIGASYIRSDTYLPETVIAAADRVGMVVEQRVPLRSRPQDFAASRVGAAQVAYEAVRRTQPSPSMALVRVDGPGQIATLEALARYMNFLDGTRPLVVFRWPDQNLLRPGFLAIPGTEGMRPAIELETVPETATPSREWELIALPLLPTARGKQVDVAWATSPDIGTVTGPQSLAAQRIVLTRANTSLGAAAASLPTPEWLRLAPQEPRPARKPTPADILGPLLADRETSRALHIAFRGATFVPAPDVTSLTRERSNPVQLALVLPADDAGELPVPETCAVTARLRPSQYSERVFPTFESHTQVNLQKEFRGRRGGLVSVTIKPGEQLPLGQAVLEFECRIPGYGTLRTVPQAVVITEGAKRE